MGHPNRPSPWDYASLIHSAVRDIGDPGISVTTELEFGGKDSDVLIIATMKRGALQLERIFSVKMLDSDVRDGIISKEIGAMYANLCAEKEDR